MTFAAVHGVRGTMVPSHPRSIALALLMLISMAAGVPHQDRAGQLEAQAREHEGSFVELNVGPRGAIVRRASLADTDSAQAARKEDPAEVTQDGAVTVVSPAGTSSEVVKLEELTEECMMEEPTAECMEKFGSYGIRRLFTETWENIQKLKLTRNGWMSHPVVQKRKLFDLTLPGSVNSGTYAITGDNGPTAAVAPYGVVSQNLNFYHQLEAGVRMFDIRVGYSAESELVYISHGALMVPIAQAIKDLRRYLEEHVRDIVVLDVKKDPNGDPAHQKALLEEEINVKRIPGQLVHEAIACELKEMLVTYTLLTKLPDTEQIQNPTLASLTDAGGQVLMFWEGQQVLCTTFEECSTTPGWYPPDHQAGSSLSFGQPFALGTRGNKTGSKKNAKIIEPMCNAHSSFYTKSDQPEDLMKKIQVYSQDMPGRLAAKLPKCMPVGGEVPDEHAPTVWYTVDAWVVPTIDEESIQTERMRGVKAIYTRGEGFTVKTESERTNYLLMSWYLKKDAQPIFTKPNAIMMEFVSASSMPIIRIIEAMQGRPECGWAIYCKESGSCWADTLLGPEDQCLEEEDVVKKLKDHSDGAADTTTWIISFTICVIAVASLCCLSCATKFVIHTLKGPPKPKAHDELEEEEEAAAAAAAAAGAAAAAS